PPQTTTITGDFTQTGTGKLGITIDSLNHAASLLQVGGNAEIGGLVVPHAVTLLPGPITVVTAGSMNSTATGQSSLTFNWNAAQSGNSLLLTPSSNFQPQGVSLTASQSSMASYLTRAWTASDTTLPAQLASL